MMWAMIETVSLRSTWRMVHDDDRKWSTREVGLALVALACAMSAAQRSEGQYYYQPAPSYYQNDTLGGTVAGGAIGAVSGALIGGRSHRGEGALIGAGVGALTGNVLGRSQDRADEQRAASGAAVVAGMNQQAAATAVTNYDLVNMTRAGVGDDLIISTMQSRGARLDLSPQGLIALKQSGVSDRVVMSAQAMGAGSGAPAIATPVYAARPTYVAGPPTTVIVTPGPPPYWYGPRPYYYGGWHHHHHRHCW
jgi:hypothetical protein